MNNDLIATIRSICVPDKRLLLPAEDNPVPPPDRLPAVSSVDGADYWRQKGLAGIRHKAAQNRYPGV